MKTRSLKLYCGWTGLPLGSQGLLRRDPSGQKCFLGNTLSITESKQLCFANLLRFSIIFLLILIYGNGLIHAQTITTTAGSVTSCPGEIQVPVNVTNCNGIGAISLVLTYNNAILTYVGYQNLNAALSSGLLIVNSTGNRVVISWANTTAANIGTGTLMQLRFNAVPGSGALNWDTQTPGNCEYSDTNGNILAASFTNGTATINQPPAIIAQPVNTTALVGQNTGFSLTATGTSLTYLWQISTNGGSSWSDLANNSVYSGVTSPNLNITNVLLTYNGYKYRCKVSGTCTPIVYSDVVTLTVINPVTTTLPTTGNCPGSIIVPVTVTNFTSVAAFSLVFSYNTSVLVYNGYQSLNSALAGGVFVANSNGGKVYLTWYSTTAASMSDGNMVELLFSATAGSSPLTWDQSLTGNCEYTNLAGSSITSVFVNGNETIYGLPTIVSHPAKVTIAKGQNTSFSVSATGSGLSYQWQVSTDGGSTYSNLTNGGVYSNVTTTTMNITGATLAMSGYYYRCKVTGTCPPIVYSNGAQLTVLPNVITTLVSVTSCPGSMVVPVTVTDFIGVASFSLALKFNTSTLTYSGYQNLNASLSGGSFAINAVNGCVYLTWSRTTAATITGGGTLIELIFTGTPGSSAMTWDTQTAGYCEYSDLNGLIIYSTWNNGTVNVNQPPVITADPVNRTIYSGGSTTFTVSAYGTGLGYTWQVSTNGGSTWTSLTNTSPYSGVFTATLTINPAALAMNGYLYRCYVTGTCTPYVYSAQAGLTVTAAAITTTAGSISSSCTGSLSVPVNVTNCNNVGAISLALNYDPAKLIYDGYESPNAALASGILAVNTTGSKVLLNWASTTAVNIGSGQLIKLKFQGVAGISTTLNWDTQTPGFCEYSDLGGTIITSFYTNSTISIASGAIVANAGSDASIVLGNSTQLNGTVSGGVSPYTYLWAPSTGLSNPAIANPVASPTSTTTYTFTVTGNNGCAATDQVKVTVTRTLNVHVLLEGLYDGGGLMHQAYDESGPHFGTGIADQIQIELHAAAYGTIAYASPPMNLSTSGAVTTGIPVELTGSYYITIKHRNSIETTTAALVTFAGTSVNYTFDAPAKAYGGNLVMASDGQYLIYGGDTNQDDLVDATDMIAVDNQSSIFGTGYISEDVNGDGLVDATDLILVDNNSSMFVGSILP